MGASTKVRETWKGFEVSMTLLKHCIVLTGFNRDNDVPKNIKLRFKDKFYDVRPIAKATYAIVGGFKGVPAEMKVLRNYEGPDAPTIRAEINRLIQVGVSKFPSSTEHLPTSNP